MKKYVFILLICTISGCDDEPEKDPFNGTWVIQIGGLSGDFKLTSYKPIDVKVNNEAWSSCESRDVENRSKIGQLILRKSAASDIAIIFFNCRLSNDKTSMTTDSVWVYNPMKTVHKNHAIHRLEK